MFPVKSEVARGRLLGACREAVGFAEAAQDWGRFIITLCCSTVFGSTKRIDGRCTASQIASASAVSFFCRLTYGLT
jgi:hypothetical protein